MRTRIKGWLETRRTNQRLEEVIEVKVEKEKEEVSRCSKEIVVQGNLVQFWDGAKLCLALRSCCL